MERSLLASLSTLLAGCTVLGGGAQPPAPGNPSPPPLAIPARTGPLGITVIYPRDDAPIAARDSTFIFGNVGRGEAGLTVNGYRVPVLPNGAWLAWLPLPDDSVATFAIVTWSGPDTVSDTVAFRIAGVRPECLVCAWLDSTSLSPRGRLVLPDGETVRLRVRAVPGATVRLILADGDTVPLLPDVLPDAPPWGIRAFTPDTAGGNRPVIGDWFYGATTAGRLSSAGDTAPSVEVAFDGDTLREDWPVAVTRQPTEPPEVVAVDDDTAGLGDTDSLTVGRALPGGTYHWFFPTGTPALVTGRWNGLVRLGLSRATAAWVDSTDVRPLPPGTPAPSAVVGTLRLVPLPDRVVLRVALSARVPFRIDEDDRALGITLYSARADIDWVQYGETDSPVAALAWDQETADEVRITARLAGAVWGYRARWQGRDLLVEIRRPPAIDAHLPLRGRTILLDPGHPPLGATGPSGQREPDVTLAVARAARALLEARGARVQLTRDADTNVSLTARVMLAERGNADALVSIHTNALPDGVNPFVNHGSSTYYFHPRSLLLARAVNRAVVAAFGTRDLGVGRADLALARPSWLPAVLVEGLFQMIPEQDAWLGTDEGRRRYAQAIVDGLEAFFAERGANP